MFYDVNDKIEMVLSKLSILQKTMPLFDSPIVTYYLKSVYEELDTSLILLEEIKDELELFEII